MAAAYPARGRAPGAGLDRFRPGDGLSLRRAGLWRSGGAKVRSPGVRLLSWGQHYPASDIPAQARKLYMRNIFRIIADVKAVPVPIMPAVDGKGMALDQSLSVLRAVSPIHIEYLRNMGVGASLSIYHHRQDGKLWGLMACHHYAVRACPAFAYRTAAELFGQMFSLMLESRERRESAEYENRARAAADRLMATVAQDSKLSEKRAVDRRDDLRHHSGRGRGRLPGWQRYPASGPAPDQAQFGEIVKALNRVSAGQVFATDSIQTLVPDATGYADRAAGLIAIPLSRSPRDYVMLFRSEQLRCAAARQSEKPVERGPAWRPSDAAQELRTLVGTGEGAARCRLRHPSIASPRASAAACWRCWCACRRRPARSARAPMSARNCLIAELNHRVRNISALDPGAGVAVAVGQRASRSVSSPRRWMTVSARWPAPMIRSPPTAGDRRA